MSQLTGFRRGIAFVAIILGYFIALLDTTIVNVTLPVMTRHFNTAMDNMSWIVNGYNLAFAVFLITASDCGSVRTQASLPHRYSAFHRYFDSVRTIYLRGSHGHLSGIARLVRCHCRSGDYPLSC